LNLQKLRHTISVTNEGVYMANRFTNDDMRPSDYLRATDTVGRPFAIAIVLLIIAAIAVVIFALFWGGRWVANNLDGTNEPVNGGSVTVVPDGGPAQVTQSSPETPSSNPATSGGEESQSSSTGANTESTQSSNNEGVSSGEQLAVTGVSSEIPNTGSTDMVMYAALLATIIGTIGYRRLLLAKR
jgi:cell division septation protein DedD